MIAQVGWRYHRDGTSAMHCQERLISGTTCCISNGTQNVNASLRDTLSVRAIRSFVMRKSAVSSVFYFHVFFDVCQGW